MIPEYPEFKPLELRDRYEVERSFKSYPCQICELSMATLFVWKKFDRPALTYINGNLCVLLHPLNEPPHFQEPVGKRLIGQTVQTCLDHAGVISRASAQFVSKLSLEGIKISPLRDHFDYIYSLRALAELKGRKFDGKRNQIKKFKKQHPGYRFVPFDLNMRSEAFELFDVWCESRRRSPGEAGKLPKLAYEAQRQALEIALENFNPLGLLGGALVVCGKLIALVIGSGLNETTACIQFMYVHPKVGPANQVVLWEACRSTFAPFRYINMEQDLGLNGLRRMKLSYQPLRMEEKYEIRKENGV